MEEKRRAERFVDGQWIEVEFLDLKVGDKFRLYEPDGTPVDHDYEWIATSNAYINQDTGVGTIEVDIPEGYAPGQPSKYKAND